MFHVKHLEICRICSSIGKSRIQFPVHGFSQKVMEERKVLVANLIIRNTPHKLRVSKSDENLLFKLRLRSSSRRFGFWYSNNTIQYNLQFHIYELTA